MSKLVGLHLRHRKLGVAHAGYIHRLLLGVLVENKHYFIHFPQCTHTRRAHPVSRTLVGEKSLAQRMFKVQCEKEKNRFFMQDCWSDSHLLLLLLCCLSSPCHWVYCYIFMIFINYSLCFQTAHDIYPQSLFREGKNIFALVWEKRSAKNTSTPSPPKE